MSSICFCVFCSSFCLGANCDCSCACACFPSAVATMAFRTLSTPIFAAADSAAPPPVDCARIPASGAKQTTANAAQVNLEPGPYRLQTEPLAELTFILTPLSSAVSTLHL